PNHPREAEYNLLRRGLEVLGNAANQRMMQHLSVRSEQRETLVRDLLLPAKQSHLAVPAEVRITTILHKRGSFGVALDHLLKVSEGDIAHTQQARAASGGSVKHIAVDVLGPEMCQGTR